MNRICYYEDMLLQYSKLNRYLDDVNKRLLTMLNLFNFSILRNLNEYLNKHNFSNSLNLTHY